MKKEPQYALMSALALLLLGLAILTAVPRAASKPDLVGYHTICSYCPLSTLILLGLAAFSRAMRDTLYKIRPRI
jgi:hypothetical protein